MQTIGEKLEEARKHRGISIREASEVTKIRSDYLGSFENNNFDLNIPDIYIRGFLRAYAQFLKLNPEKIITDFNAHLLGESKFAQRGTREFLGRMDLGEQEEEEGQGQTAAPITSLAAGQPKPAAAAAPAESGFDYRNLDRSSLIKGAAAVAGAAVMVAVIVTLVLTILKSGPDESGVSTAGAVPTASSDRQEFTVIAEGGDILSVTVTEIATGKELFRGPLGDGESRKIPYDERVRLTYTHAEYLFIEKDGQRYSIGGRGMRQSSFP